ncbi:MAG: NUDIX hydrolase [Pseudomonadota bacterium]
MRRFGEAVVRNQDYRDRPGVYAIIRQGSDLLVTVQSEPKLEIQLPGGGIDAGESPIPALHRECLEETGWKIRIFRKLGAFQRFTFMPDYNLWAHKICHIYLGAPTLRVGEPTECHHEAVWMPIDAAAELLGNEGDRHFVSSLLG